MANEKLVAAVCKQFVVPWLERFRYLTPVILNPNAERKKGSPRSGLPENEDKEAREGITKALLGGTDSGQYLSFPGWTDERKSKDNKLKEDFVKWWKANGERLEKECSDYSD